MFKTGNVDKKVMHRYERDSELMGKGSFKFAWVTDESASERSHGKFEHNIHKKIITMWIIRSDHRYCRKEFTSKPLPIYDSRLTWVRVCYLLIFE